MLPKSAPSVILGRNRPLYMPLNTLERNVPRTKFRASTNIRANFATSAFQSKTSETASYEQIPEHLKIHMFTPELEILRNDELRAPFKNFSESFILKLLEERANEIRLETGNSNPSSRLNNDNVVRFMKVLSRLRQLFDLNGGNTEVLDAVINSQSTLNAFEAKLAAKRKEREETQKASERERKLYAPGPYLQIPDSLEIHDFVQELDLYKREGIGRNYGDLSAHDLVSSMEKQLRDVQRGSTTSGINERNFMRFQDLLSKLKKLLAWNGGVTSVLDTLLDSQVVFNKVEKKILARNLMSTSEAAPNDKLEFSEKQKLVYNHVPDDAFLEEFREELEEVRSSLNSTFAEASSDVILQKVRGLAEGHSSLDKKHALYKLYRNLAMLFSLNGGATFALDMVLINCSAFDKLEASLRSSKKVSAAELKSQTKYRDSDYVITLLNKSSGDTDRVSLREEERTIQSALAHAMSKEEKLLQEKNPSEYEQVVNLTSEKIRGRYHHGRSADNGKIVEKDQIESFLKKVKQRKETAEENKWREQTAFEWSTSHTKDDRSFEAHNFFSPIMGRKSSIKFPMFPGTGEENEYLILTSNGQKFHTQKNPLGMNHIPKDMFSILRTLSEEDLAKFSSNIEKLRKKGWRLIGSGKTPGMLVLSKETKERRFRLARFARVFLTATGAFFITLLCSNLWLPDSVLRDMSEPVGARSQSQEARDLLGKEKAGKKENGSGFWHKLLWR